MTESIKFIGQDSLTINETIILSGDERFTIVKRTSFGEIKINLSFELGSHDLRVSNSNQTIDLVAVLPDQGNLISAYKEGMVGDRKIRIRVAGQGLMGPSALLTLQVLI